MTARTTPLADLGLAPRSLRALYDEGWGTVGDVMDAERDAATLTGIPGIGAHASKTLLASFREVETAEAEAVKAACKNCRWWVNGACHRFPPSFIQTQIQPRPERPAAGVWPQTDGEAFCGEFERRP